MTLHNIGVIGAGQMGSGIAHVAALAGRSVTLVDVTAELVERGRKGIERNLGRQVEKGKVAAGDRDAALSRLVTTTELAALSRADLVVEAVVEDETVKRTSSPGWTPWFRPRGFWPRTRRRSPSRASRPRRSARRSSSACTS